MSRTSSAPSGLTADIGRIVKYAPAELIGREAETKLLSDAWDQAIFGEPRRPRVITFVALGGEGKTSLVARWTADLAFQDWPGCDAVFAWSFYSQGTREQTAVSSDLFLSEALTFFGDAAMAGSAKGPFEKGRRLAQLVGARRTLLILDGLEPLQYAPTSPTAGELKDQGLASLLKGLAAANQGLCLVTTRYSIFDLRGYWRTTAPEVRLLSLSQANGVALLKKLGVNGRQKEFEKLVEDVKGHALTLNLIGTYLRDAHAGDIRQRDVIKLEEADAEEQAGHAFHVMDAYVRSLENGGKTAADKAKGQRALALLQLLGLFDRPATGDLLKALWQPPAIAGLTEPLIGISEAQRNMSLTRLEDAKLLTVNRAEGSGELIGLDAHPLLREYFARRVRHQQPEAWRAAHRRLYEHLCATTKEGDEPTLEHLQPLYQAVAHGCQAGLQQEACDKVYFARILRGQKNYSSFKLGAVGSDLGAIACFFDLPWSRISSAFAEDDQAWLLNETAFTLRALGRLTEALEPMRAVLEISMHQQDWKRSAVSASNLSELELTLGEVAAAVEDAKLSVTYADHSGDAAQGMARRTAHADALHQTGRWAEAEARFREAEQMQAKNQPAYPLLYSVQGFQYCDLLLAQTECAAWQMGSGERGIPNVELIEACRAISVRAAQTLQWILAHPDATLLDIALDHLTLGRTALYAAILEHPGVRLLTSDLPHIDDAVSGLRRASTQEFIVLGLLTRAWLRSLTGASTGPDSAQSDLDEAWEIAERGSMRLFLADIHLYRARLFGLRMGGFGTRNKETEGGVRNEEAEGRERNRAAEPYPWESSQSDLEAADNLITSCGYHRRDEELADAKRAIFGV